MSYIYVITNDINGKQYVGKTNNSIEKRFQQHKDDSKRRKCERRPLYNAMNKYGIEHFSIKLLEECSEQKVSEKEIYWIDKLNTYHNGYNATHGGDGKQLYNYQDIIDKYQELQCLKDTARYFKCSTDTVRYILRQNNVFIIPTEEVTRQKHCKAILMCDKNTKEPIKKFNSAVEAGFYLGDENKAKHIGSVCAGKRKSAYGYYWCYA